jgi:hypothetical protein
MFLFNMCHFSCVQEMIEAAQEEEQELAAEMAAQFLNEDRPENVFGAPKAGAGMWASVIRILNPINGQTLQKISLEQNEAAHRSVRRCWCYKTPCDSYLSFCWSWMLPGGTVHIILIGKVCVMCSIHLKICAFSLGSSDLKN